MHLVANCCSSDVIVAYVAGPRLAMMLNVVLFAYYVRTADML